MKRWWWLISAIELIGLLIYLSLRDINITLREVCVASPPSHHVAFRDFVPPHP